MRLTIELTLTITRDTPDQPEQHDTTLDTLVERSDTEPARRAELDHRLGFKP